MKQYLIILFLVLLMLAGACSNVTAPDNVLTETDSVEPTNTSSSEPTSTRMPDFSDIDFSGIWHVAEIIDSNNQTVSEEKIQSLGGDFTIEFLKESVYFVHDVTGTVLGQGTYLVSQNQIILSAADEEICYEILDEDTICSNCADGSMTVMKRTTTTDET